MAAYVAVAVLLAIAAFRYVDGRGEEPAGAPVAVEAGGSGGPGGQEGIPAEGGGGALHVHVAGRVESPGLYRMPAGARVGAAIDRAGGTRPGAELAGVNLAAELQDGQQVVVPERGAVPPPAAGAAAAPGASATVAGEGAAAAPVSLAQATPEQLDASVDGIGPVLAARIIEFRDERGSVSSIDELVEVDGIGEARIATLREALVP